MMILKPYKGKTPTLDESAHAFEGAILIGDVTLKKDVGVWYNSTLRGDMAPIFIDEGANVQDNAVIHTDTDQPTHIGKRVTIGHSAIVHAATVNDDSLIGMGSIILNGATVEENGFVAAGAIVPPGKTVKSKTLVAGNPAREIKTLNDRDIQGIKENGEAYIELLKTHYK